MVQKINAHIIPNTHWDMEWYQSHEKYLTRLIPLMDRLLDIMENDKNYRFTTDGQFVIIADYLEARPENAGRIKALVREGRLLVGPWFTQPLETLVSGEAMVRNLQYGIRESERLGGSLYVSYEVDEFGHASQTPQILKGFGIDSVITWRGIPNSMPLEFEWLSPDGSSVFVCRSQGYGQATNLPSSVDDFSVTIDGKIHHRDGLDKRVHNLIEMSPVQSATNQRMWLNGIDHSWAQPDISKIATQINERFPLVNAFISDPAIYTCAMKSDLKKNNAIIPKLFGELMDTDNEVLASVHSIHVRQKLMHYKAERYLERVLEPTMTFAWLLGGDYNQWAVDRAWRLVLQNHAHDSLGCTSVDEVYHDVMNRSERAYSLAEQTVTEARRYIMSCDSDDNNALYIFNSSAYNSGGITQAEFTVPQDLFGNEFYLTDDDGNALEFETLTREECTDVRYNPATGHPTFSKANHICALVKIPKVPRFGFKKINVESGSARRDMMPNRPSHYLETAVGVLENQYLKVKINQNGTFDLTNKVTGYIYTSQLMFEDAGDAGDLYVRKAPQYDRVVYSAATSANIALLYDNPLGAAYEISLEMKIPSTLSDDRRRRTGEATLAIQTIIELHRDSRRVDLTVTANNTADFHRLRVLFPTNFSKADVSRSGQPFDTVTRPIHEEYKETSYEQPYATHPMQDFCDVSNEENGLVAAACGIYEYECIDNDERALALTLMRSNGWFGDCFNEEKNTVEEARIMGKVTNKISLIPHMGNIEAVYRDIELFVNQPVLVPKRLPEVSVMRDYLKPNKIIEKTEQIVSLFGNSENLVITSVKKAFDRNSIVVRLLNRGDGKACGCLKCGLFESNAAFMLDLNENRVNKITDGIVEVPPYGIVTVEIKMDA